MTAPAAAPAPAPPAPARPRKTTTAQEHAPPCSWRRGHCTRALQLAPTSSPPTARTSELPHHTVRRLTTNRPRLPSSQPLFFTRVLAGDRPRTSLPDAPDTLLPARRKHPAKGCLPPGCRRVCSDAEARRQHDPKAAVAEEGLLGGKRPLLWRGRAGGAEDTANRQQTSAAQHQRSQTHQRTPHWRERSGSSTANGRPQRQASSTNAKTPAAQPPPTPAR